VQDIALVRRILNGDKKCGERFVTTHYPRIYRLLHCLTGSADTAQDLTQQAFARAWQALDSYQGKASLATWLHKIAYHEYTHWLRARRDEAPIEAAANVPDLREARGLDSILVSRALGMLPNEQREPFLLYYMQQFSVAEVSEMLEVPAGTVKSRLFAARARLRALLQVAEAPLVETETAMAPSVTQEEPRYLMSRLEGGHG